MEREVLLVGDQFLLADAGELDPVARRHGTLCAGVVAIEIRTGRVAGSIEFTSGIGEVDDVQVLPGIRRAGLQGLDAADGHFAVVTPHAKFWVDRGS